MGTSVTATTSEQSSENTTTMAISAKKTPAKPARNTTGAKTAIVVRVPATIAPVTSRAPSMAA